MTHAIPDQPVAEAFDLGSIPLLAFGHERLTLAKSERLISHVMVIAEGGEIAFHAHRNEDHLFIVLAGEVQFDFLPPQDSMRLGPLQGILIPSDCYYRFRSVAPENLVLARVGSTPGPTAQRVGLDGRPLRGKSAESGWQPAQADPSGGQLRDVFRPARGLP